MRRVTASAPGKIHFLGEHSVVYGKPALLAALNLRCAVTIQEPHSADASAGYVEIVSKNLNQRQTFTLDEILKKREDAQKTWEEYALSLDSSLLQSITHNSALEYALIVVGEVFHYCHPEQSEGSGDSSAKPQNDNVGGFQIIIDSEIPIGSGLGSSSAIAVSLAAALISFLNFKYDKAAINEIAYRAEQKQHGFPSGADVATSVYGGLMWFKKNGDDPASADATARQGNIIEPLRFKIPEKLSKNFLLIDSGKPEESTGEMVGFVKKLHIEDSSYVEEFLDSQANLTIDLAHALENGDEDSVMASIKEGELNLEKIGVVSEFVKQIMREIENSGGVAKICGGGGRKHGTGMLLSYHPDPSVLQDVLSSLNLPFFSVELGGRGVTITRE